MNIHLHNDLMKEKMQEAKKDMAKWYNLVYLIFVALLVMVLAIGNLRWLLLMVLPICMWAFVYISDRVTVKYSFEGTITKLVDAGVCETGTQIMGDLPLVDMFFDDGTKMTATTVGDVGIFTDRKKYWNFEEGKRYSLVYTKPDICFNKENIAVIIKLSRMR